MVMNAWAISAYGGVLVLIEVRQSGTPITQMHAAGAIKNVAIVEEIRVALGEEGAVEVLLQLLVSGSSTAQEKSANCLWILASDREDFRVSILELGCVQNLQQLLQKPLNTNTLEHVLRAISALSVSDRTLKILSSSASFLLQLAELINNTILPISFQQISVSILSKLSISDAKKRPLSSCMASLVKMVEFSKSAGLQETAAEALVSLLSVRSNSKELVKDEKSLSRFVQMLDPNTKSICKKLPVVLISAIVAGGSNGCRKRLILEGACHHLQKLSQMEVVGAKKVLQRLVVNRLKNIFSRTWQD
ncbi:hypothetical protein GIB67_031220 [Kingdonia uniflora]|uniref:ARM repeat superfamily protein n=1 Tax=Kingdonia uniflora TaxID=39325 RepID=A0A7J7NKC1_9MAGN|nr:hypothetical protein GIB67_031220 [Kingdonia uniflora]